jgi:thioesterase domain-containing protein
LREQDLVATVVIQHGTSNYLLPVTADFAAHTRKPDAEQLAHFVATLQRRGRARIELRVTIEQGARVAVDFIGRYVVILRR